MASRFSALMAALLLPAAHPVLLGAAASVASGLVFTAPVTAQSVEAVGKIAQAITVRIEGAGSPGSGVLVKRDGNRYTVLTAWHVVSGQRPGEELAIVTQDGQGHPMEPGSVSRLGEVDLAVLTFSSPGSYELAQIGDVQSVSSGSTVYVSGFPLPTSAVPTRIWRFLDGKVIANATVAIPNGYQLLYSNPTLPGMSGGAVLNAQGKLVGIHASAERADQLSESTGKAVATGTNQAVPIAYYGQWSSGKSVTPFPLQAATSDDYLAQAKQLLGKKGREQEVIRLSNQALALKVTFDAYFYRAFAKSDLGDKQGAVADYTQSLGINPKKGGAYLNRCILKYQFGDKEGAIADCSQALAVNPQDAGAYFVRGTAKYVLGDKQGAIADSSQALLNNPQKADFYFLRGVAKNDIGDKKGAIDDYTHALFIQPQDAVTYLLRGIAIESTGDLRMACVDWRTAASIGSAKAAKMVERKCL